MIQIINVKFVWQHILIIMVFVNLVLQDVILVLPNLFVHNVNQDIRRKEIYVNSVQAIAANVHKVFVISVLKDII